MVKYIVNLLGNLTDQEKIDRAERVDRNLQFLRGA